MRRLAFLIPILLAACAEPPPERDWNATFSPYGKWKSDLGFTIDITRDNRYRFCDDGYCLTEQAMPTGPDSLVLRRFHGLATTQRLFREADIPPECDKEICGFSDQNVPRYRSDLEFHSNVANVVHRRQCGGERECVILGNVETAEGMFYKIGGH